MKSAVVITPTIGQDYIRKAIESVDNQTYKNLKHLIVVDGVSYWQKAIDAMHISHNTAKTQLSVAPENTGATGGNFWGHRIYAAYPHLVNEDYIFFLDEDNWFEPDHVESMINTIERNNYDWCYSLRKIYTEDGEYVAHDNCESLGRWPVYWSANMDAPQHLIDSSAYCFKREFLIQVAHIWHFGWGGDRRFYNILSQQIKHNNYGTNKLHTLNYRLDDQIEKKYGDIDFFSKGNSFYNHKYDGSLPWLC